MRPDDPRHGEERGYYAHRKAGQEPCDPCKRGHMRAEKIRALKRMNPAERVDQIGYVRRLQALARLGWTAQRLAAEIGISHYLAKQLLAGTYRWQLRSDTAAVIAEGYERLCMTFPTTTRKGEQSAATHAQREAIRRGWAPPLAWDDIDDPNEKPDTGHDRRTYKREQLLEEFFHLVRQGDTHETAARRLGVTTDAIEKARERARKDAAA